MDIRKQMLIGIITVALFLLLATVLAFIYTFYPQGQDVPEVLIPIMQYHVEFMMLLALFGVLSGLTAYGVLTMSIGKEKQAAKTNASIIMKFLSADEQEILALLIKKEGRTTQGEIGRLPGMTRLKAHRFVKKLEGRGLVHVEKEGKINFVRLVDEMREIS
ncbi:MAG: hypothetical protein WC759_00465 [Candidatus Micrarchaeia archaeon]